MKQHVREDKQTVGPILEVPAVSLRDRVRVQATAGAAAGRLLSLVHGHQVRDSAVLAKEDQIRPQTKLD